jgi:hypothetical protein
LRILGQYLEIQNGGFKMADFVIYDPIWLKLGIQGFVGMLIENLGSIFGNPKWRIQNGGFCHL